MSRQEAKRATRAKLMRVAADLFREKGVAETKIGEITKTAGVAPGTFYVHFEGKHQLVDHFVAEVNASHVQTLIAVAMQMAPQGARPLILAQVKAHLDFWFEHVDYFPLYADHLARHATEGVIMDGINQEVSLFAKRLFVAAGVSSNHDPVHVAASIVAVWRQFGLLTARTDQVDAESLCFGLNEATIALLETFAPELLELDGPGIGQLYAALAAPPSTK